MTFGVLLSTTAQNPLNYRDAELHNTRTQTAFPSEFNFRLFPLCNFSYMNQSTKKLLSHHTAEGKKDKQPDQKNKLFHKPENNDYNKYWMFNKAK